MLWIHRLPGWIGILSLGCAFSIVASAQHAITQEDSGTVPLLTLDEALTMALANNRNVKIASLGVDASRQQILLAKTKRFPSISTYVFGGESLTTIGLTIKAGQFGSPTATGPIPLKDTTISTSQTPTAFVVAQVSQPLLALHKINLNIAAARLATDQAGEQFRSTRQSIAASVRQAYYGVVQAQEAVEAVQADLEQYKELDRITTEYVLEKTALESDTLQVKAKLAQEQYSLMQASDKLSSAEESLNDLMGRDINTQFRAAPAEELLPAEEDLHLAQAQALAQQPAIREAGLTVKQAEIQRRLAKAQYLPELNASVHYISPFGIDFLPTNIAAAGIEFKWDAFDWGGRGHTVRQKTIALEQSQQQLEETKSQVLVNVDNQFRGLQEARAAVSVAKLAQQAAREKLRETTNQYGQKTALFRDVLQQQATAQGTDAQYLQAVAAFWTAKANLDKAIGEE
jgi:outer membrane protein TolC